MSHAVVLVVTDAKPTEEELGNVLAPYHEFESTGENEYIQEIDITDDARKEYEGRTVSKVRDPDGNLHSPYDAQFYRDPTAEEAEKIGTISSRMFGPKDIDFDERDWEDGQGRRAKVREIPAGYEQVEVPNTDAESFRTFVENYHGYRSVSAGEEPDLTETHKFGYVQLDETGEVVKVIRRTNPNAKWDWYSVGGRWSGWLDPDYDPHTDPDNIETCKLCGGSGRRNPAPMMLEEMMKYLKEKIGTVMNEAPDDPVVRFSEMIGMDDEFREKFGLDENGKTHCNGCDGKGTTLKWPTQWVEKGSQSRWGDVNRAKLEEQKREQLGKAWDEFEAVYNERITKSFPDEKRTIGDALREYDGIIADLRASYTDGDNVPLYQKIENHPRGGYLRALVGDADMRYGIKDAYSREEHMAQAPERVLSPFAIVKDGKWLEGSEMGWFGSHADAPDWPKQARTILDSIQPDQWVTVVDYHI